jgi:hypothetical protein
MSSIQRGYDFYEKVIYKMFGETVHFPDDKVMGYTIRSGVESPVEIEILFERGDNFQYIFMFNAIAPCDGKYEKTTRYDELEFFDVLKSWFNPPELTQDFTLEVNCGEMPKIRYNCLLNMEDGEEYTADKWIKKDTSCVYDGENGNLGRIRKVYL